MEILNTIWTALTTQNETLINWILFPLAIIEFWVTLLFSTTLLNIQTTKKQKFIFVSILSCFSVIANIFLDKGLVSLLVLIITPLLFKSILKTTFLKGFISMLLTFFTTLLLENIISRVYLVIFDIPISLITTVPLHRIGSLLLIYLIIFLAYLSANGLKFNITILDDMKKETKKLLLINCGLACISIITQVCLIMFYNDNLPLSITLLSTLSLLAYFVLSITNLSRTTTLELRNRELEEVQLYNKTLTILHDNIRAFKHDFNNIVQSLGGYILTEDLKGLKIFYQDLLVDCQKVNNLTVLSPEVINNPAIYSLLTSKYHKAEALGIKINLDVFLDLNTIKMSIYEFTRILGILIDNAIEATNECIEKVINITIRKNIGSENQILVIENTYNSKDINIDKIYEKGFSTKEGNTGLGLWEVRKIVKKYDNLDLFTSKNSGYFKQEFTLY